MKSVLRFLFIYIFSFESKTCSDLVRNTISHVSNLFYSQGKKRKKNVCAGTFIAILVIEIAPRLANCTVRLHMANSAPSKESGLPTDKITDIFPERCAGLNKSLAYSKFHKPTL